LWIIGLLTAVLTAVYMTRMMWMTFFGEERFTMAFPDGDHAADAAHAEENAFAHGDAHDAGTTHGDAHAMAHHAHDEEHDAAHDDHDDDEEHHHIDENFKPHESPWTMWVPLAALAILSTVGGLVGIPYAVSSLFGAGDVNAFEHTLAPVIAKVGGKHGTADSHSAPAAVESKEVKHFYASSSESTTGKQGGEANEHPHSPEEIATERLLAVVSVLLALAGIAIGWLMFRNTPLRKMPRLFERKWYVDELYNGYIVDPLTRLSREGLWKGFDLGFIDGIVNGAGHFVSAFSGVVRQIQVGFVRSYAAFILLGALFVLGYFIYYGFRLI
jgi:NADH-quinone oxidoreductase subunit L